MALIARSTGTTENLRDVVFANDRFVAVGENGTILTSTNSIGWTRANLGVSNHMNSVTFGGSLSAPKRFIVCGEGDGRSTTNIWTSPDGIVWTGWDSGTTNSLYAVHSAQPLQPVNGGSVRYDQIVAVGAGGTIVVSTNGAKWVVAPARLPATVRGLNYYFDGSPTEGKWIAVGDRGLIATSSGGMIWTVRESGRTENLFGVSVIIRLNVPPGGPLFMAVGADGTILTSFNLETWTPSSSGTSENLYAISGYSVLGANGTCLESEDIGRNWKVRPLGTRQNLRGLWSENQEDKNAPAMIVGSGGTILGSALFGLPGTIEMNALAYGNNVYVANGPRFLSSTNGLDWIDQGPGQAFDGQLGFPILVFGNGRFVSAARDIYVSTNGTNWVESAFQQPPGRGIVDLTFGNGRFVALHASDVSPSMQATTPGVSTDGLTWEIPTDPFPSSYGNVAFLNNQFIYISTAGVFSSPDGSTWNIQGPKVTVSPSAMGYHQSHYVLLSKAYSPQFGIIDHIQVSTDLISWQNVKWRTASHSEILQSKDGYSLLDSGQAFTVNPRDPDALVKINLDVMSLIPKKELVGTKPGYPNVRRSWRSTPFVGVPTFFLQTTLAPGAVRLQISGIPHDLFGVEYTPSLSTTNWQFLGTATNTGSSALFNHGRSATNQSGFYRARMLDD